jgi:hypothetical protein
MDMYCKQYLGTAALLDSRLDIGTCVIDRRRERQPALKPYNFELGNRSLMTTVPTLRP